MIRLITGNCEPGHIVVYCHALSKKQKAVASLASVPRLSSGENGFNQFTEDRPGVIKCPIEPIEDGFELFIWRV